MREGHGGYIVNTIKSIYRSESLDSLNNDAVALRIDELAPYESDSHAYIRHSVHTYYAVGYPLRQNIQIAEHPISLCSIGRALQQMIRKCFSY